MIGWLNSVYCAAPGADPEINVRGGALYSGEGSGDLIGPQ